MTIPVKKRKLSAIDFSTDGCHVALVSKNQGGPANGVDYALIMKANNFSEEFVQKMQQVQVTLELPDFLRKFFGVYYEDAEVLARLLGYVEPETDVAETDDWYENYIQSKVDSFTILKSLNDGVNLADELSKLDEDQHLAIRKDQALLEKAMKKIKKNSPKPKAKVNEGSTKANAQAEQLDDVTKSKVEPSETLTKGKQMDELEIVQKALADQKVELQKALDAVAALTAEKKETISKARFDKVEKAVKDKTVAEVLFKALSLVEDEAEFNAAVEAVAKMQTAVEKSALFTEQGAQVETEGVQESAVAKVLKARHSKFN